MRREPRVTGLRLVVDDWPLVINWWLEERLHIGEVCVADIEASLLHTICQPALAIDPGRNRDVQDVCGDLMLLGDAAQVIALTSGEAWCVEHHRSVSRKRGFESSVSLRIGLVPLVGRYGRGIDPLKALSVDRVNGSGAHRWQQGLDSRPLVVGEFMAVHVRQFTPLRDTP